MKYEKLTLARFQVCLKEDKYKGLTGARRAIGKTQWTPEDVARAHELANRHFKRELAARGGLERSPTPTKLLPAPRPAVGTRVATPKAPLAVRPSRSKLVPVKQPRDTVKSPPAPSGTGVSGLEGALSEKNTPDTRAQTNADLVAVASTLMGGFEALRMASESADAYKALALQAAQYLTAALRRLRWSVSAAGEESEAEQQDIEAGEGHFAQNVAPQRNIEVPEDESSGDERVAFKRGQEHAAGAVRSVSAGR